MIDRIKVIDGYPGIGKTQWAIQNINDTDNEKIIYITPFLEEVKRVINSCPQKNFTQPSKSLGEGSKLRHFIELIKQNRNIVSTHALFSKMNNELIELLKEKNYVLYLDEVFQTVLKYNSANDNFEDDFGDISYEKKTRVNINTLINTGLLEVQPDGKVIWKNNDNILTPFESLRIMANQGLIYFVKNSFLVWTFPIQVFEKGLFKEIFILTHRFDYQLQSYYYKYYHLEYSKYCVIQDPNGKYHISKDLSLYDEETWKKEVSKHITILNNNKMNAIGDYYKTQKGIRKSALSKSWYKKSLKTKKSNISKMRRNLKNFFRNITKSSANERLWTCFKSDIDLLMEKNIDEIKMNNDIDEKAIGWIPINARSTNDWDDRKYVAYLINDYIDPCYTAFFNEKNRKEIIDEDQYALSELIQWIWRSRIRKFEDIILYLPSRRMRELLIEYLGGKK